MSAQEDIPVLLLDDEKLVRMTISAWLRPTHFKPVQASNATEALAALKSNRFQAIISDVMMDGIDGFQFRELVRQSDARVPVIFLTALVNDADNGFMRKVMSDVNSYYVPKTAPKEYLVGKLEQVVKSYVAENSVAELQASLDKSLDLAKLIQTSMLPPWIHGTKKFFASSFLKPLDKVGGDVYHSCRVGEDEALFFLGDISGHGVSSALAMTAVQAFLNQYNYVDGAHARDVVKIAREIDDFLAGHLHGIAYMPITIIYYNAAENRVRYLNAGNPRPKVFSRKDGSAIAINPDSKGVTPLGLIPQTPIEEKDVVDAVVPEDALVFAFSDGYVDVSTDEAGEDRLPEDVFDEVCSTFASDEAICSAAIPQRILATVDSLGYDRHQDDMALLVFGRKIAQENSATFVVRMNTEAIDAAAQRGGEFIRRVRPDLAELSVKVELLLDEHLMNVHDHALDDFGRRHDPSVVRVELTGDYAVVSCWDHGREWTGPEDIRARPEAKLDRQNEDLGNHGRGEAIMRKIATRISRQRFYDLNQNIFYIPLNSTQEGSGGGY